MKKLMMAVAVALTAVAVNAASCTWNTMAVTADMSAMIDGGTYWLVSLGTDSGVAGGFTVFDDGTYDFGSYSVVDTGAVNSGAAGSKITGLSAANNGDYYALVVWDGTTGPGGYFGVAEGVIAGIVDTPPTDATAIPFDNLGFGGYMATDTATVAVPEPTSGLLMLIGFAGLALRRRRA